MKTRLGSRANEIVIRVNMTYLENKTYCRISHCFIYSKDKKYIPVICINLFQNLLIKNKTSNITLFAINSHAKICITCMQIFT